MASSSLPQGRRSPQTHPSSAAGPMTTYRLREFVPTVREAPVCPISPPEFPSESFHCSADVARAFAELADYAKEAFCILMLDGKNRIIGLSTISIGTNTRSLVDPKEVFRAALVTPNCCGLVCVHQHPSGVPDPSQEDIQITRRIVEGGKLLNLRVLDHVILGRGRHFSFADEGML